MSGPETPHIVQYDCQFKGYHAFFEPALVHSVSLISDLMVSFHLRLDQDGGFSGGFNIAYIKTILKILEEYETIIPYKYNI
jgi:hypothetical protein